MATSSRYQQLVRREIELRRTFLPLQTAFSATGEYDRSTRDKAGAYRLLMHAEFENYLEDAVRETCALAIDKWTKKRQVTRALLGLVCMLDSDTAPPRKGLGGDYIILRTINAFERMNRRISGNNGIKEENVYKLLCCAGFLDEEIDSTLIATMNSFGRDRGNTAHQGISSGRVTKEIDPKDELDTVLQIISGLGSLDEKFNLMVFDISELKKPSKGRKITIRRVTDLN